MNLPRKHSGAELTIFSEMTALANEYSAVNLSQGFPDYDINIQLKDLLSKVAQENHHQYAPMAGNPRLIAELINFNQKRTIPIEVDAVQITITPGATYGIFCALASILSSGDEVIVLEPAYDSYVPAIEINGGKPVFVSLKEDFTIDFYALKDAITCHTKAIIFNTPHNPTGKVMTNDDWQKIWEIISESGILIISDEVYDLLVYDRKSFASVMHHPFLKERAFAVYSFGKMFHITGWKIGYVLAAPSLSKLFRDVHQYLAFSVNAPAQEALANYLQQFDWKENSLQMKQRRDFFIDAIQNLPFTLHQASEGSYFQVLGFEKIAKQSDIEFARWLTKAYKVAVIPISAFYHDKRDTGLVRFCFAKKEATIMKAIDNLHSITR